MGWSAAYVRRARQYRFLYTSFVKTTLDIHDDLLARAKALAAKERTTLTKMVEEGLSLRLREHKAPIPGPLKALPISTRRGGLRDGVDGTSNRSLLEAADE